jgi:hypothetical protein
MSTLKPSPNPQRHRVGVPKPHRTFPDDCDFPAKVSQIGDVLGISPSILFELSGPEFAVG